MIGKSGERGSGISVLAAQHDDDDDFRMVKNLPKTTIDVLKNNFIFLYLHTYMCVHWQTSSYWCLNASVS